MPKIFLALAALCLTGCTAEMRISKAIERANYCSTATDCVFVDSVCPFGCYIFAHKNEAAALSELLENYESSCMYSCARSFGTDCVNNICQSITQPPAAVTDIEPDPAGNVGAACNSDDDCVTPLEFLTRSSCPFKSVCQEGSCAVVCPQMERDSEVEISRSWPVSCISDADCTCAGYGAEDLQRCACIDDACYAVISE